MILVKVPFQKLSIQKPFFPLAHSLPPKNVENLRNEWLASSFHFAGELQADGRCVRQPWLRAYEAVREPNGAASTRTLGACVGGWEGWEDVGGELWISDTQRFV